MNFLISQFAHKAQISKNAHIATQQQIGPKQAKMEQQSSSNSSNTNKLVQSQAPNNRMVSEGNSCPLDLKSLLESQLQEYNDLEDEEFEFIEDNFEEELRMAKQYQSVYMHQHSNVIPIGTNYQAIIPQLLPEQHYKIRSKQMISRLNILKINDPKKLIDFTEQYQHIIKKYFEQFELTEQDYSIMYNNYKQYGKEGDVEFENYLQKTLVYWNKYFLGKQKIVAKTMVKKKKKKNKGSIPI